MIWNDYRSLVGVAEDCWSARTVHNRLADRGYIIDITVLQNAMDHHGDPDWQGPELVRMPDRDALAEEVVTLAIAVDRYRTALQRIADIDYRGNRSVEQSIAIAALNQPKPLIN